jgi:hypothetical protein
VGGRDDSDYAASVLVAGVSEVRNGCENERREDKYERQYLRDGVRHGWLGWSWLLDACGKGTSVRGFKCVRSRPDDRYLSLPVFLVERHILDVTGLGLLVLIWADESWAGLLGPHVS